MAETKGRDTILHRQHEEEVYPKLTLPQGVQDAQVGRVHEARDIDSRRILLWLAALLVVIVFAHGSLWGGFRLLERVAAGGDVLPSPLFHTRKAPPEPRLLPNPIQSRANPTEALAGPGELMQEERLRESRELRRLGLEDPETGLPALPEDAVSAVVAGGAGPEAAAPGGPPGSAGPGAASGAPEGETAEYHMPSGSSGGTAMENALQ